MEKRILLFCFLVFVAANKPRPTFETYKGHKKTNGFDYRPIPQDKNKDAGLSSKIRGFFEKKRTINILQNPNIPTNEKLQIIDETIHHTNTPKAANIFAGGLMSEWDFDMAHNPPTFSDT
jgi:hypothetical protein